jgi:hypothetical protein
MAATRTRKRSSPHSSWSREDYLVDALATFEALASDPAIPGGGRVKAKAEAVKTREALDLLRATDAASNAPVSAAEHRAEILGVVRRLRVGASAAGSYIAAGDLLRQEHDLVVAAEAATKVEAASALAAVPDADLDADLEATVAALLDGLAPDVLDHLVETWQARGPH